MSNGVAKVSTAHDATRNAAAWMLAIVGVPRAIVEQEGRTERYVQFVGLPRAVQHGFLSWVAKHHPGATEEMKDHDGMLRTAPEPLYHAWIMDLMVPEDEAPTVEESPDKRWWGGNAQAAIDSGSVQIEKDCIQLDCYPWLSLLATWRYPPELRTLRVEQARRLYASACTLQGALLSNAERKLMSTLGVDHARK